MADLKLFQLQCMCDCECDYDSNNSFQAAFYMNNRSKENLHSFNFIKPFNKSDLIILVNVEASLVNHNTSLSCG